MFYGEYDDDDDRITLYEQYKLVEKTEPEVSVVWKGAHLLLFFLAFVFGSFCTFCFHMLMYMFDDKCVLFPKLMSLSSLRQSIIYEFIPEDKEAAELLPVDFLSTKWVEKSACNLPTYVPLVSGIFGLVWTTMFLMCSVGSRVLTGLQRPWRVLPPVFLFSIVMGILCVYTSSVTQYGLEELCDKLNEITGGSSCSYTINVATLAYHRKIRGVYQATRLTIASAWLHTYCWLLSALLSLLRILLAVDFKLVRVRVQLRGNLDRMLERHERQLSTVSPAYTDHQPIPQDSQSSIKVHFMRKRLGSKTSDRNQDGALLYYTDLLQEPSRSALVTNEGLKLNKLAVIGATPEKHQFIVKMLYNLLDIIDGTQDIDLSSDSSSLEDTPASLVPNLTRMYGQQKISSHISLPYLKMAEITSTVIRQAEDLALEMKRYIEYRLNKELNDLKLIFEESPNITFKSSLITPLEARLTLDNNIRTDVEKDPTKDPEPGTSKGQEKILKSSLKQTGVQTDERPRDKYLKVQIESRTASNSKTSQDKETQTAKEKQD